jgi:glutamine---fructose-6-phosphate transaminase (isomerizing)
MATTMRTQPDELRRLLGEPLSVFALTVWVQRIALQLSQARGISPDRFRFEEDRRRERAVESLGF